MTVTITNGLQEPDTEINPGHVVNYSRLVKVEVQAASTAEDLVTPQKISAVCALVSSGFLFCKNTAFILVGTSQ